MDTKKRQQSAMLCWAIWKSRNDLVWNQRNTEVLEVVVVAKVILNQWKYAQDKTFDLTLSFLNEEDGDERWMIPQENKIKVNCDAAIFEETNTYSYAFIGRDHAGAVLEAKSVCRMGNIAPENAEAIGVREALSWIKEQEIQNARVETDCVVVVQAMRGSVIPRSYFGRIINECSALLRELEGKNISVKFVKDPQIR
ncbi:hypothetical protein AgCh_025503 [Apium graveolens]